jgi:hypothetical protein
MLTEWTQIKLRTEIAFDSINVISRGWDMLTEWTQLLKVLLIMDRIIKDVKENPV